MGHSSEGISLRFINNGLILRSGMSGAFTLLQVFIRLLLIFVFAYIIYFIVTKAFREMGFSSVGGILIVFIAYLFRFPIVINGIDISNIYLFSYNNWHIFINMGGAVIPLILSAYLILKNKLSFARIVFGVGIVTVVTYSVTHPVADKGIVSPFPYFLLPAIFASAASIIMYWKERFKAAPLAYTSATIGVLIGADFLHLPELLLYELDHSVAAVIGGAVVLDMIFITGIIAVFIDSILLVKKRREGIT